MTLIAVILGLEIGGRFGRKFGLQSDDVWNTGLIAFVSGLIVARLWNVFQFASVYRAEPNLLLSLRPSGFAFWPGVAAAIVAGYLYLLWRGLDPLRVLAALSVGGLISASVLGVSGYLTGSILGLPSELPWALDYFGVSRHPAGLYLAIGSALLAVVLWVTADPARPGRTVLWAVLGYSLLRLFVDGFREGMELAGPFRISQIVALAVSLVCVVQLARGDVSGSASPETVHEAPDAELPAESEPSAG